jgi:hypothetical protein
MTLRRPFTRQQRATIVTGMLAFVVMLVVLQLWLLTATMNASLGGDDSIVWAAAGVSSLCLLLNLGLLRYLGVINRFGRSAPSLPLTPSSVRTSRSDNAPGRG